jgi:hypothetical protein
MKKVISLTAVILVLTFGFIYLNQGMLKSGQKDGDKNCSSTCSKNKDIKAGGEWSEYEFVTDKACSDEMKTSLQADLMNIAGVKEVKFGSSCSVSKMTMVRVYYSSGETSEENIASFVKDKSYDCQGHNGCNKDGIKSGESKDGTDCPKECPHKDKSKESKQL